MRDSSPPEATLARLLGACPGFALTRNSTSSLPLEPNSASLGATLTANRPPAMPSPCMSWVMWDPRWPAATLARFGQALCGAAVVAGQCGEFALEGGQAELRVVEGGQFRFDARQLLRKLQNAQAVLSAQGLEGGGMALDFFLAGRIDVEHVQVAAQHFRRFLGVDHGLRQQLPGRRELRIGVRHIAQRRVRSAE